MSYVYNPRSQLLLPLTLHPSGQMPYWNNNSTATILDVASSIKNKITLNETSSVNNDNYSDIYDGIDNIDSNNNNNNVNYLSRSDIYGEIDNTDNTNTNNNNYLFSNDTVNDNFFFIACVYLLIALIAYLGYLEFEDIIWILKGLGILDDLDNLDLNRTYTFEEFEFINEQLKTYTLEINETPVDLFEFNKGKILPMPQNPISKEAVVCEISSQLRNWNVQTRENGIITTSQGGFDFNISGQRAIRAPDVAFIPKNIYRSLNHQQQWTFKGQQPFTLTCVVEVAVTQEGYQEFNDLDQKFREVYFATGSSVELGWLVDPQNKQIYIYRRRANRVVYRTSHGWNNVNGGNVLPGFTLEVEKIDDAISQKSSESSSSESDETINCLKCGATFSNDYTFMKH
ncbi:13149_t:CDS:2 [Entrophospora sp. SA101]|nr:13149_t:CDS:2 [Entrophospora sp. SA101]